MKSELDNYDWAEVFGEGDGGRCTPIIPSRPPFDNTTDIATFSREDVEEITAMQDGENDGPSWIIYGKLKDGRWFYAEGGCDYTGWDCQAGNSGAVAATREQIERFGLGDNERSRFGIVLE